MSLLKVGTRGEGREARDEVLGACDKVLTITDLSVGGGWCFFAYPSGQNIRFGGREWLG